MEASNRIALIADPDEFFRLALSTLLTAKFDFSMVIEATLLDDAIEQLSQEERISLALFELALPDIKSPACFAAVRQCFPHVKTVVISNSHRKQDVLMALEAGAHGFVPKGIKPSELADALDFILRGHIYVPPSMAVLSSPSEETRYSQNRALTSFPANGLTPRQKDVLELLVEGKTNKEIARALDLGEGTVKVHMAALFRVFGVNSRAALAVAGSHMRHPALLEPHVRRFEREHDGQ